MVFAPLLALLAGGCVGAGERAPARADDRIAPEIVAALEAGQAPEVLVLVEGAAPDALRSAVVGPDVELVRAYARLPLVALRLRSRAALERIAARREAARVFANERFYTQLATSLPLVGQPTVAGAGQIGAGVTVAVIDTGVDYRSAAFGACAQAGAPGCKVVYSRDFAPDDESPDDVGHGTHVAAIALGVAPGAGIVSLDVFRSDGYAYATDILAAIDWVIRHRDSYGIAAMNLSLGGGYTDTCDTHVLALGIARARDAGILAAVAAGNDGFSDRLAAPACASAAVSVGAVYSKAYGRVKYGVCTDATTNADAVTCFSNISAALTVLAPGAFISAGGYVMAGTSQAAPHVAGAIALLRAAFPHEPVSRTVERLQTSRALVDDPRSGLRKPRLDLPAAVAGCSPSLSADGASVPAAGGAVTVTIRAAATCAWTAESHADWIRIAVGSEGRGDGTVELAVAANPAGPRTGPVTIAGRSFTVVQEGARDLPTGVVWINDGAVATNRRTVSLTILPDDPAGVAEVCISHEPSCSAWRPYAVDVDWQLTPGDGVKEVFVHFRSREGAVSPTPASARILLDTAAPIDGEAGAIRLGERAVLHWFGFTDTLAGIAGYRVVGGIEPPGSCEGLAPLYEGPATTLTQTGLDPEKVYFFRLCAVDAAGNVSEGILVRAHPHQPTGEPI